MKGRAEHRGGKESVYISIYLGCGPEALELKKQLRSNQPEPGYFSRWLRKKFAEFLMENGAAR